MTSVRKLAQTREIVSKVTMTSPIRGSITQTHENKLSLSAYYPSLLQFAVQRESLSSWLIIIHWPEVWVCGSPVMAGEFVPHADMVRVKVWACAVCQCSYAETLLWVLEWRMTGVEKSAQTHFCQSSPLCPRGASLSWICLPLLICTHENTHTHAYSRTRQVVQIWSWHILTVAIV